MRLIFLAAIGTILAGCAAYEKRKNPFADLEPIGPQRVAQPAETPAFPRMEPAGAGMALVLEGERLGTLTATGARWLARVDVVAHGNAEIAAAHAEALSAAQAERDALLAAGRAEYELAESRGRLLHEARQGGLWRAIRSGATCVIGGAAAGAVVD